MISITAILIILFAHWVGDFVLQSNKMAMEKSRDYLWLTVHVFSYTIVMYIASLILFGISMTAVLWVAINAVLHWITDFNTSRLNVRLKEKSVHYFFVGIGADQTIHYACLFATFALLT